MFASYHMLSYVIREDSMRKLEAYYCERYAHQNVQAMYHTRSKSCNLKGEVLARLSHQNLTQLWLRGLLVVATLFMQSLLQ